LQGLISHKEILLPFLPVCACLSRLRRRQVQRTGRQEFYN